jgi:hypothetical protein
MAHKLGEVFLIQSLFSESNLMLLNELIDSLLRDIARCKVRLLFLLIFIN